MSLNAHVYAALCGAGRRRHSATDPHFAQVVFLGHFDGTNGSTTFVNSCPRGTTVTANGTGALTTTSPQFGTACLACDATATSYATTGSSADYTIGTGDFTLECSVYATTTARFSGVGILGGGTFGGGTNAVGFTYLTGTPGGYTAILDGATTIASGGTQLANTWVRLAWTRSGTTNSFYVDGVRVGTATSGFNSTATTFRIGKNSAATFNNQAHNIDEVRLTVGFARYTGSSYSVATAAFPNS